jgi:hypothetical protein
MEFHKEIRTKKKPEIITKKKIAPKARIFSSYSQSNLQTVKKNEVNNPNYKENLIQGKQKLHSKNDNKSLIDNIRTNINENIDKNDKRKHLPSSSLVINLRPKHLVKRPNNIYNQIRNPNPMKQMEYQYQLQSLHSSQMSIPSTNIFNANANSKTNSKDKKSNSSMIGMPPRLHMYRSANNINSINNNELEIEINPSEEQTIKRRYHRSRKFSPLFNYNNIDNEEIIYNVPFSNEDSMEKLNPNLFYDYYDAYDINEGADPVQLRVINKRFNKRNNNLVYANPFLYSSDEGMENSVKYEEDKKKEEFKKKKYVRNYTDIYDPKKNKKGLLLQKNKMTLPLSETYYDGNLNFLVRNSKLSDLIMAKKKFSPDPLSLGYEEFLSGSEDKTTCQNEPRIRNIKTFNRRSLEKFREKNKTFVNMHKSPEQRFKNVSLAMLCSKGKNTENRPISREMRFEKGGVVDLSPSNARRKRYKYLIRKMKRTPGKQLIHNNPKYREKAAELIQEWWNALKEYRKKRIKSATLIQSFFRGRFVRKYLYDVIYMNYLYFGFCKKIEKFTKKKYGPYFFEKLFGEYIKRKKALKKIISNYDNKMIKISFNKWKKSIKDDNRKQLSLLYLLRIRVIRDSKIYNLKRFFTKWNYIAIIQKERSDLQKT